MKVSKGRAMILVAVALLIAAVPVLSSIGGLDIGVGIFGEDWQKLANEAEQCQQDGRLDNALDCWKRAVAISEKFGDKDERYTTSLHALAQLQSNLGQFAEAQANFLKVVDIEDKYHRGEFLGLTWNLCQLGDTYYQEHKYQQAAEAYKRAAGIDEASGRMMSMVTDVRKLARTYAQLGDYRAAGLMFSKAEGFFAEAMKLPRFAEYRLALLEERAQLNSDRTDACNKAKLYKIGLKFALAADKSWQRLSELSYEVTRPPSPPEALAKIVAEARKTKQRPVTMLDEIGPGVIQILERLAYYYCHMGKPAEAELLYGRIVEVFNQMAASSQDIQSKRMDFMSEMYRSWHSCHTALPAFVAADNYYREHNPALQAVQNPFLTQFASIKHRQDFFQKRMYLPQQYAWAIPTAEALDELKRNQPIVEAGAGTGYWTSLLRKMGVDIVAYDIVPVPAKDNAWHFRANKSWSDVLAGDESVVEKFPERTLFICWPPGDDPFAFKALSKYEGKTFIYVGEDQGGCNGNDDFFDLLRKDWALKKTIAIPQWPSIFDRMYVYERKKQ